MKVKGLITGLAMMVAATAGAMDNTAVADSAAIADSIAQAEAMTVRIRDIVHDELSASGFYDYGPDGWNDDDWYGASLVVKSLTKLLVIAGPFVMVCVVVGIIASQGTRRRRLKYEMVNRAIERGYNIPEYVFREGRRGDGKSPSLNGAVVWIAVGLGLIFFFNELNEEEAAALSSMILLLGLGKLAVYILDERKKKKLGEWQDQQLQQGGLPGDASCAQGGQPYVTTFGRKTEPDKQNSIKPTQPEDVEDTKFENKGEAQLLNTNPQQSGSNVPQDR